MNNVLTQTAETILQKPIQVEVGIINPSNWQRLLILFRIIPSSKRFLLQPLCTGSLIRISSLLIAIDHNILRSGNVLENSYNLIRDHGRSLAEMIAIAFTNTKEPPSRKLIDFLVYNLTALEMRNLADKILTQMSVENFITTIISVKGMSLLKKEEIIASGEQSVA